jgi:AbrB family looped-hinge helix DNA binding protein
MVNNEATCCKIDAIASVDSKGQIVLPKDIREKMRLKPNDKLALVGFERDNEICCVVMIKAEKLENTVSKMLGPMLKDVLK